MAWPNPNRTSGMMTPQTPENRYEVRVTREGLVVDAMILDTKALDDLIALLERNRASLPGQMQAVGT